MGENLADMMIGNIWWFSESMVSHSTIWELVTLLSKYSPPSLPSEAAVFKAMSVLMDVFNVIQVSLLCGLWGHIEYLVVFGIHKCGRATWVKEKVILFYLSLKTPWVR